MLIYGSIPKSAFRYTLINILLLAQTIQMQTIGGITLCRFGTFEFLKSHAVDEKGNLPPVMRLLCGLGAGKLI